MRFADRVHAVTPSRTTTITALIARLRAQGRDIVNLAAGETDFAPPEAVKTAVRTAMDQNDVRYGPVAGLPALRERLSAEFTGLYGGCGPENIIVSNGAKQILYTIMQALVSPGDEVIIPGPCWVSLPQQIRLAGGVPVIVLPPETDTADDPATAGASPPPMEPALEALEAAVTPRTRIVLINSPNNPTGAVYSAALLDGLAALCRRHDLWLVSDEAYEAFLYGQDAPVPSRHFRDTGKRDDRDGQSRLVAVRSFSKTYSMTGLRAGYAAGPVPFIREMEKIQSHLSGNVCTAVQRGALAALDCREEVLAEIMPVMIRRRDFARAGVSRWGGCPLPAGAFYLFPDVRRHLKGGPAAPAGASGKAPASTVDLCAAILEKTGVAAVPGEAFGQVGHLRISYAAGDEALKNGLQRLAEFFG